MENVSIRKILRCAVFATFVTVFLVLFCVCVKRNRTRTTKGHTLTIIFVAGAMQKILNSYSAVVTMNSRKIHDFERNSTVKIARDSTLREI